MMHLYKQNTPVDRFQQIVLHSQNTCTLSKKMLVESSPDQHQEVNWMTMKSLNDLQMDQL